MLGELERSRKVFKCLDTAQKCIHAVLAWKSGIKSAAWMLSWDFNSFFLRYFNNRRLLLRLVVCFMLLLIPVSHLAVGIILITFLAEVKYKGMSRTGSCREKNPTLRSMYLEEKEVDLGLETTLGKKKKLPS